jgi:hypothetical protein
MQFGRIHALALAILGFILFGVQATIFFSNRVATLNTNASPQVATHKTNPVPGILGSLSLIAAATIFVTRRRADEPKPEHAIR